MKQSRDELLKRVYDYDQEYGGPLCIQLTDAQTGGYKLGLCLYDKNRGRKGTEKGNP